jgi:hypothetical protein
MVTADKHVVAHLYTTSDDTEVGNEYATHLLGLCTLENGGSDSFDSGVIKAEDGVYVEVLENNSGSTADAAILTVSYVAAEDCVDAYPSVAEWRYKHWESAEGRQGTMFSSNYFTPPVHNDSSNADGGDGSGSGGSDLEVSERVFLTDELHSNLKTGSR